MRTVRIMLALAVALSIAIPLSAQEKKAAKGKRAKLSPMARVLLRMDKFHTALEGLDLTAEQKEKLGKMIREELAPKLGDAIGKFRDILTEEQRTTVGESFRKAREAGKEGNDLILAIESSLTLTDEEKQKTDKVRQELAQFHREMAKKVMGILTPEQKGKMKKKMAPQGRKQGDKKAKPGEKKKKP